MKKIITLSITLVLLHSVFAQSGMLDSSFDKDGKVISNGYDGIAYASLLQPEGKILVGGSGGYYKNNKLLTGTLLARYNADGSPDVNFAIVGKVYTF